LVNDPVQVLNWDEVLQGLDGGKRKNPRRGLVIRELCIKVFESKRLPESAETNRKAMTKLKRVTEQVEFAHV